MKEVIDLVLEVNPDAVMVNQDHHPGRILPELICEIC